ncbi:response regulator [Clostridium formicaceticum]|uniref:Stage 0 sporulation protein A homolog n=1 Tax=Clostridium formicaceticum TaxID=1497 RepID=A0AAC9RMY8_9CLOT|nr:response regulator [Clostridium formicaceticum]AOY77945.1 response regulator [Clostridium formicaceticum]ARE88567.1 Response regulator MprA [Clostridium formicaceticum]
MRKVLIADDTKNIRQLLITCLQHEGYDVTSVENGEEAIEAFKKGNFDLAFIDIKMPKISGTEVLRQIRSIGIKTPVIIITAFATVKNAVECTQMGAVAYMQKPFTTNRIKQVLQEVINENKSLESLLEIAKNKLSNNLMEEALTILKKALSIDPACANTYYLLAKVYEKMGNLHEAKHFSEVYKLFQEESE